MGVLDGGVLNRTVLGSGCWFYVLGSRCWVQGLLNARLPDGPGLALEVRFHQGATGESQESRELGGPETAETLDNVGWCRPCGTPDLIAEFAGVGGGRRASNRVDAALQLVCELKTLEFFKSPYTQHPEPLNPEP